MLYVDSTEGVCLAVHDLGGQGPELLLAHATGFHAMVWQPMAAALTSHYHCWALDYRAHGRSTAPAGGRFAWGGFGHDTEAVVDALGLKGAGGVGHSMGGAALVMAELARPGTFRGLVLFEPIIIPADIERPEGPSLMVEAARRRRSVFASRDEAYENFASKPPLDVLTPEALRAYVDGGFADTEDGMVMLRCQSEHEARVYEMGGEHDTFTRLDQLKLPVLVLGTTPEPFGPSAFAERVADAIPNGSYRCIEGIGHFGPLRDPALIAGLVDDFFAAIS